MPSFMGLGAKRIAHNGAYAERVYVGPYLAWQSTLRQERLVAGAYAMAGQELNARRSKSVLDSGAFLLSGSGLSIGLQLSLASGSYVMAGNELEPVTPFDESNIARTNITNTFTAGQRIEYSNVAEIGLTMHLNDDGASSGPIVELIRHSTTPATNDFLANIRFIGYNSSAAKVTGVTVVGFVTSAAAATYSARLEFWTTQSATFAVRFYIGAGLVVGSATGGDKGTGSVNATELYRAGTLIRDIAETLTNKTLSAPVVTGIMDLQGGRIKFPATQIPSSDANTLDDYEEGTWTPNVAFQVPGTSSFVYTSQVGSYIKIGRFVFLVCRLQFTPTKGTAAGALFWQGAPFTSDNVAGIAPGGNVYSALGAGYVWPAGVTTVNPTITPGATQGIIVGHGSGIASVPFQPANVTDGVSHFLNFTLVYEAAT